MSAPDATLFADVSDLDHETFGHLYRDVLAPSFSAEQLFDEDMMRSQYLGGNPALFGSVAIRGGLPVAGALGEYHEPSHLVLLNYLAVRCDSRRGGLGERLLRHVLPQWRTSTSPDAILAEVEDPRYHESGPHGDPAARLHFYERLGATLLPIPYFQPALGPRLSRVQNMVLICLHTREAGVPSKGLARFLDDYVGSCEGETAKNTDPDYRAMRDRITSWPDLVPTWPMSRLNDIPDVR